MELRIADLVPTLNAPTVSYQLQQGFWDGAKAGDQQVGRLKWLAIKSSIGGHLDNRAGVVQAHGFAPVPVCPAA